VSANGLNCAWPRWDEDPQGQGVIPGSTASDVAPLNFNQPIAAPGTTVAGAEPVPLLSDPSVILPGEEVNETYHYKISLPPGIALSGAADERETMLGHTDDPVHLRIHYLPDANHNSVDAFLPFVATGDEIKKTLVKLSSGKMATLVEINFMPALHPDERDLAQKQLFIPSGEKNADFIVLTAKGAPEAMKIEDKTISSIFASCQGTNDSH